MTAPNDASRAAFEAHLLAWTGRDAEYHARGQTTGLEFAWSCWQAGAAVERERWTMLLTEKWHSGEGKGLTLAQYLGMSAAEYAAWVVAPDAGVVAP